MKNKNRQKNLSIIGGILFLIPFFVNHGLFRLYTTVINWDKINPEIFNKIIGDVGASLFFLLVGGSMVLYGLIGRTKREN